MRRISASLHSKINLFRRSLLLCVLTAATLDTPLLAATTTVPNKATTKTPKLVVVLVVDGLPNEQVLRYRHQFGEDGFKRLVAKGPLLGNAH